jgi:arginine N-succinyltransferase
VTKDASPSGFEIRAALPSDLPELVRLARHMDTVNLPHDEPALEKLLLLSEASFRGVVPKERRRYLFALSERASGTLVGTSTLVAKLGSREAPYIYLSVSSEEKYSRDLDLHLDHVTLQIGFSYDGPTELAGLVVDPAYRRRPGRLGLCISYIRFLFVAAYPDRFEHELLAELLPPLEVDGTSHLWDALGRRFTGMTYRQADRLSHENKDFIRALFPSGTVYATLLSDAAQNVIGAVGQQTKGVEKMLRRVGFRYAERIDPFDGGPHFVADVDEVTVIRRYTRARVALATGSRTQAALVSVLNEAPPYVRAISCAVEWGDPLFVSQETLDVLGIAPGDVVHAVPVP